MNSGAPEIFHTTRTILTDAINLKTQLSSVVFSGYFNFWFSRYDVTNNECSCLSAVCMPEELKDTKGR
jgi:hypothetical protein